MPTQGKDKRIQARRNAWPTALSSNQICFKDDYGAGDKYKALGGGPFQSSLMKNSKVKKANRRIHF